MTLPVLMRTNLALLDGIRASLGSAVQEYYINTHQMSKSHTSRDDQAGNTSKHQYGDLAETCAVVAVRL
jgi:hypothetical protein